MRTSRPELDTLVLTRGSHVSREQGVCLMEAVAWWAGEGHSAAPRCVSPVLREFGLSWNDGIPSNDARNQLKRYVPLLPGTHTGPADDEVRSWMALDWLVRVHAPAWLRLAGLIQQAAQVEALPELRAGMIEGTSVMPTLNAARAAARAALQPAVYRLQESAHDLFARMITVGRAPAAVVG